MNQQQLEQVVCRCCLLENPLLHYNIYVDNLFGELTECLPHIRFEPCDGLPSVICEQCWWQVREANEFRRNCILADEELRRRRNDESTRAIEEALDLMDDLCREQSATFMEPPQQPTPTSVNADFGFLDATLLNDLWLEECSLPTPKNVEVPTFNNNDLFGDMFNSMLPWDFAEDSFSVDKISDFTSPAAIVDNMPPTQLNPQERDHMGGNLEYIANNQRISVNNQNESINNQRISVTNQRISVNNQQNPINDQQKSPTAESPKGKLQKCLYPCPECEKKFTRNFQLKLHLISVHNIGDGLQYLCSDCDKTFASRHSLNYHQKSIHSKERPFGCDQCCRRFILRTQLISHQRIHSGEMKPRSHPCLECAKHFLTKSDLKTHVMRSHRSDVEKPFKCDYCEKSFFTRSHMASHLLVHTGEKPYLCVLCGKSYQSVGNLNNHMMRRHGDKVLGPNSLGPKEILV